MMATTYKHGSNLMRIALDAMGGDKGLRPAVEGAVWAVQKFNIEVILVGHKQKLQRMLDRFQHHEKRIHIVDASDVVQMTDQPREALRKQKSSMAIAVNMAKDGKADAVVSPGNTGAMLAHSQLRFRNLPGIKKPGIATLLPSLVDRTVIIDTGAAVDCKPRQLVNFAIMGSTYARVVLGRPNPRIGLLNIGEEESKGNEVVLESYKLLRETGLNFVGNAEGRDIFSGEFDVITCDGFMGNIALKTAEGCSKAVVEVIKEEAQKSVSRMVGGALLYPAVRAMKKRFDWEETGGSPLLGVNGISIIAHGSSNSTAIMNALRVASESVSRNLTSCLQEDLLKVHRRMGDEESYMSGTEDEGEVDEKKAG